MCSFLCVWRACFSWEWLAAGLVLRESCRNLYVYARIPRAVVRGHAPHVTRRKGVMTYATGTSRYWGLDLPIICFIRLYPNMLVYGMYRIMETETRAAGVLAVHAAIQDLKQSLVLIFTTSILKTVWNWLAPLPEAINTNIKTQEEHRRYIVDPSTANSV